MLVATVLVFFYFLPLVLFLLDLALLQTVKARCVINKSSCLPLLLPEWALGARHCPAIMCCSLSILFSASSYLFITFSLAQQSFRALTIVHSKF